MPILVVIIFLSIGIIANKHEAKNANVIQTNEENEYKKIQESQVTTKNTNEENINWKIEIPSISLTASISEGTEEETLNKFVGHFTSTPKLEGNIGLAAHNRGYPINYFENLKQLKGGEEIIYTYGEFTKTYVVTKNVKISEIDWSYLENINQNQITLITCIENEPQYRRCVQAIEKEAN